MPYITGSAANATALRDAITTAATANGWTWDSTNQMLYKGAVYAKLTVSGLRVIAQAARGYSGGTLTQGSGLESCISDAFTQAGNTVLAYPVTYRIFIHTNPDDIVVAINYQTFWWQWLAFGRATPLGAETNPIWQWGSTSTQQTAGSNDGIAIDVTSASGSGVGSSSGAPFWTPNVSSTHPKNAAMYVGVDGAGWRTNTGSGATDWTAATRAAGLLQNQPNAWNGEAILLPLPVYTNRASGFQSAVGDLAHLRMLRNDNIDDGQIITLGAEKWFIAPVYRKNTAARNASEYNTANHSGTIAIAVRYDGP